MQAIGAWLASLVIPVRVSRAALARTIRQYLGCEEVFLTGSGRGALALALRSAGIGVGDEVLLSSYTCLAVPTAVIATGATPVYSDIDLETLNVSVESTRAALSPRVRAIVVQHTLGKVAPIVELIALARENNMVVIEDCALAIGSTLDGRKVGTFGDAAIFSMELSKTLSCGWGGVLAVNDRSLAEKVAAHYQRTAEPGFWAASRDIWQTAISSLVYHPALIRTAGKYVMYAGYRAGLFRRSTPAAEFAGEPGANFSIRMGGPQARLARLQWQALDSVAATCARNAARLRMVLAECNVPTLAAPAGTELGVAPRVSFLVDDRARLVRHFADFGIEAGTWFDGPLSPLPKSPRFNYEDGRYQNASRIARQVINLPCHSRVTEADLQAMSVALHSFFHTSAVPAGR